MDYHQFAAIVASDNARNTCSRKVVQKFANFLPMNALVLNGPPPPGVTFRGRNQQQGIRAIVDAYNHYTPVTYDVTQPPLEVAQNPKAVGETSLDSRTI
jgi:hypothetical protein